MFVKSLFVLFLATLSLKGAICGPVNLLFESNGKSLKLGQIKLGDRQEVRVTELAATCNHGNKGLLRMAELHLEFCDGKSWVRVMGKRVLNSSVNAVIGSDCQDIKKKGYSRGDGVYLLDPDGGSDSNAFLAYCDMTSYNGGWTMCYTTVYKAKPKSEVNYVPQLLYGSDGYRTNCNNIAFTEIIFIDHQTGNKAYFKRKINLPIKAALNYGKSGIAYGLWDGVGAMNSSYSYQLLICDHAFYTGFFVSGYTSNGYKSCDNWCGDTKSPYFRTAANFGYQGVAFNVNGHQSRAKSLISVGLRWASSR